MDQKLYNLTNTRIFWVFLSSKRRFTGDCWRKISVVFVDSLGCTFGCWGFDGVLLGFLWVHLEFWDLMGTCLCKVQVFWEGHKNCWLCNYWVEYTLVWKFAAFFVVCYFLHNILYYLGTFSNSFKENLVWHFVPKLN